MSDRSSGMQPHPQEEIPGNMAGRQREKRSEGLRICRKCLLRESSEAEYFQQLKAYIAGLDAADRVSQEVYERRLHICGSCENLTRGMCRLCGCYVELRAALRVRKCPALPSRWAAEPAADIPV